MKNYTDREIMLILNGIAFTADLLHKTSKGALPNSTHLTSMTTVKEFVSEVHSKQPTVSFKELDELFTKLSNLTYRMEVSSADEELMNLPPSSKYLS